MMNFFDAIQKRRSVRKFSPEDVPSEVINNALDAALLAPNSSNIQPWEFYWVRSKENKLKLAEACLGQPAATTAQELIVAVARTDTWKRNRDLVLEHISKETPNLPQQIKDYYNKIVPLMYNSDPFGFLGILKWIVFTFTGLLKPSPRGPLFYGDILRVVTKTTALACENFMLAVSAQGCDSCPMEGFDEYKVKEILGLKGSAHIVMVISVGKADIKGIKGSRYRIPRELTIYEV
ncbi:MAG TPA: nitroreductase family protein [Vampirovibrionales bacterium]